MAQRESEQSNETTADAKTVDRDPFLPFDF